MTNAEKFPEIPRKQFLEVFDNFVQFFHYFWSTKHSASEETSVMPTFQLCSKNVSTINKNSSNFLKSACIFCKYKGCSVTLKLRKVDMQFDCPLVTFSSTEFNFFPNSPNSCFDKVRKIKQNCHKRLNKTMNCLACFYKKKYLTVFEKRDKVYP